MNDRLAIIRDDITRLEVDAIVNAANESLAPGAGVCGAIFRGAGPGLEQECRALGGCPTGEARLTGGHRLPARWVIHTPGPLWRGGGHGEAELLASCYRACLALAASRGLVTLAFPSISTGIYGYPVEKACRIALAEIARGLERFPGLRRVTVVCFDEDTYSSYTGAAKEMGG